MRSANYKDQPSSTRAICKWPVRPSGAMVYLDYVGTLGVSQCYAHDKSALKRP